MKKTSVIMLAILLCTICTAQKYPFTNTVDSSDTSHNITIKDPYRWMEDLISDETKNWFKEQNDYSKTLMEKLPLTDELYKGLLMLNSIQPYKISKVRQVGNTLVQLKINISDIKVKFANA